MDRRAFLQKTGIITAGTLMLPSFLRANPFMNASSLKHKRLVMIQLSGGNDGLNTVVPYGVDGYYQNRKNIGLQLSELIKLDEQFGLNPALKEMYELRKDGLLSIINSVGYPNPNRSHFRSMDIWQTGSDSDKYIQSGWLGRYLDKNCEYAYEGIEVNGDLSLAMKGTERSGIALTNPESFYKTMNTPFFEKLQTPAQGNKELDFLYSSFNDTRNSARYIYDQYRLKNNPSDYPNHKFGKGLKQIATLIRSDIQTPVFYTALGGFDTHVNQSVSQTRLLTQLSEGVGRFVSDLKSENLLKDTTIVIFSEFGRRLAENASRGTDHGAANVLFVIDTNLSQNAFGYNKLDLDDLENGDPKFKVDFRSIYQDVLTNTLKVNPKEILGKSFATTNLFKS